MRTQGGGRWLLVATLAMSVFVVGCNGDDGENGDLACEEHTPLETLPPAADRPIAGQVTIRDSRDRTIADNGTQNETNVGRVQATFFDLSALTSTPSALMLFDEVDGSPGSCAGRVSAPQISGERVGLPLMSLTVDGTARGLVDVGAVMTSTGVYIVSGEPLLDGATDLRVVGVADASAGFPGFDGSVTAAEAVMVTDPVSDGTGELIDVDLNVAWNSGNGDLIEIVITPLDPPSTVNSGGQVFCLVPDDGCYVVPMSATRFLLASGATKFELTVNRQKDVAVRPDDDTYLGLRSESEYRLTLNNGVLDR